MQQRNLWKGLAVTPSDQPLNIYVLAIIYAGDVVFAINGALTAGRHRMDILGFVLIGTITCRFRKSHLREFAPEGESGQHHFRCLPSSTC
jgi:hypothetical protein